MLDNLVKFIPPGRVAAAFMACRLPVKFIMGPVGSGKTSCMMVDTIHDASRQPVSKIAFERVKGARLPIRFSKALFVRETFRQLYGTTIPSWQQWISKGLGEWKGGGNDTAYHALRFLEPPNEFYDAGVIVDFQAIFDALGDQNVEALFKGKEFNLLRLNEADTLSMEVFSQGLIRIRQGRYPGERHVAPADCVKNVAGDMNAPEPENELYKLLTENKPDNYGFFRQPGGLSLNAENRERATYEDYLEMERDLIAQGREDLARRNVHNMVGFSRDGKPVYLDYNDDLHCAPDELKAVPGLPIKISCDQGLRPAAVLRQTLPNGQRRYLEEFYCETGAEGLAELVRDCMAERYPGFKLVGELCDPAGDVPDDKGSSETWLDSFNRFLNLTRADRIRAAETNSPEKCTGAVRLRLQRFIAGVPEILISPRCKIMRKGFNSAYCYKKKRMAGGDFHEKPVKLFPVADVMNAVEFDCLGEGGYEDVVGRARRSKAFGAGKMFKAKVVVPV